MLAGIAMLAVGLSSPPAGIGKSRGFVVAPGAVELRLTSEKRTASLSYFVREPFPADSTLGFIRRALPRLGWRPVTGEDQYPFERSSLNSGWVEIPGQRVPVAERTWNARWASRDGAEVDYTLSYKSPQAEDGMTATHVSVCAEYRDKTVAAARQAAARREKELRRAHQGE